MVDQVKVSQHDMSSEGPVKRTGNCGAVSFAAGSVYGSSSSNPDQRFGANDPRSSTIDRSHVLPPALITLAGVILNAPRSCYEMSEKGQIEVRHSVNWIGKPVFISTVGVPNGHEVEPARIVLFLTETSADHSENH